MTDKQIIIDGVDVSGCENFSCGICEEENKIPKTINHFTADCRMYPNCYYKQLKRKEQECKELKKQVSDLLNKPEIQDKILWKIDNEALLGSKDAWIYKLEQTLAEIKEIAGNMNNECFYSDFDCKYCDMKNGCTYHKKIKILQKIRECEGNDEQL